MGTQAIDIERKSTGRKRMTHAEWVMEAKRRFGPDVKKWRFVCPGCKHVASVSDYQAAGAPEGAVAFSCIGRYLPNCRDWMGGEGPGPCNYSGGGLFQIHPVEVDTGDEKPHPIFDFADPLPAEQGSEPTTGERDMKGSEYGGRVPRSVGQVAFAKSEDGNGDGVWHSSASGEADAVEELRAEIIGDGDEPTHGYIADVVEADLPELDAGRVTEWLSEQAYEEFGEVAEDWLSRTRGEVLVDLQGALDKAVGEWLTRHDLWPGFTGIENIRRVDLLPAEQPREGGSGGQH